MGARKTIGGFSSSDEKWLGQGGGRAKGGGEVSGFESCCNGRINRIWCYSRMLVPLLVAQVDRYISRKGWEFYVGHVKIPV